MRPHHGDAKSARDQRLLSSRSGFGRLRMLSRWGIPQRFQHDRLRRAVLVRHHRLSCRVLRSVLPAWAEERYPWGVKAPSAGGRIKPHPWCTLRDAAVGGILDIVHGGREVAVGSAVVYAAVATLGGLAVTLVLRRATRDGSDLVRAETAEWLGDTLLSVGVLIGFLVAYALVAAGRSDLAAYVDPGMVTLVSLAFLWVPIKLIISSLREILSMAPEAEVLDQLRACIADVEERYAFSESLLRASKVGNRMDIEIDFVVGAESAVRTIADSDTVRQDLHERLAALGYDRSVVVAFTADRRWAA